MQGLALVPGRITPWGEQQRLSPFPGLRSLVDELSFARDFLTCRYFRHFDANVTRNRSRNSVTLTNFSRQAQGFA
jgi:hypothetical protein